MNIIAKNVTIEFPIYDVQRRSLKHSLLIDRIKQAKTKLIPGMVGGEIDANASGKVIIRAINEISFEINEGERVGIIGHNGAGKSTLLRMIAGIYAPIHGTIDVEGTPMPMFSMNEGVDPDSTGLEMIWTRGVMLGMSREEIKEVTDKVVEFAELGEYIHLPIRTYSDGMLVRLAFGIATSVTPEILIMDELIGAGDTAFVEKANQRIKEFVGSAGIVLLASHDIGIVSTWCDRVILMNRGRIIQDGPAGEIIAAYQAGEGATPV